MTTPIIHAMMSNPPADLARDTDPVALLFRQYTMLIVRPDLPVKGARELVDMLREKPGA